MYLVEITNLSDIVDFSQMDEKQKELFCEKIILKQMSLATNLAMIMANEDLNEEIDKERLFGVMTRKEIIEEFMKVMD